MYSWLPMHICMSVRGGFKEHELVSDVILREQREGERKRAREAEREGMR